MKKRTILSDLARGLKRDKMALIAAVILAAIILLSLLAGLLFDYDADVIGVNPLERNQGPSPAHWFGTDAFGRDLLARVVYGSRYSLLFGIGCTAISVLIGAILGASTAYFGGIFDNLLMRFLDVIMCIPGMFLMLLMVAIFGAGLHGMVVAIIISSVPSFTRIVRAVVLTIVQQDYVEAARVSGARSFTIIVRHVIPNAAGTIIVNAMMSVAGTIMAAAGLSYIGMGIQPPKPEWGNMLSESMAVLRSYPHVAVFPGIAMLVVALCFNILGDAMADALDPKRSGLS